MCLVRLNLGNIKSLRRMVCVLEKFPAVVRPWIDWGSSSKGMSLGRHEVFNKEMLLPESNSTFRGWKNEWFWTVCAINSKLGIRSRLASIGMVGDAKGSVRSSSSSSDGDERDKHCWQRVNNSSKVSSLEIQGWDNMLKNINQPLDWFSAYEFYIVTHVLLFFVSIKENAKVK